MNINPIATIAIAVLGTITTVKAQRDIPQVPNNVLNGLFTPTAAQKFFEEGRNDFESEIQFLAHPEQYLSGDLLQIDEELKEQIRETKPSEYYDFNQNQNFLPQSFFKLQFLN